MAARANFTVMDDGLVSEEISWEEYLEAAGIEPLTGSEAPATPITHTDETDRLARMPLSLVPKH